MQLIDPRSSGAATKSQMAPRLGHLNGRRIGILVNGKANAELLATETARFFKERHHCKVVDLYDKRDASRPCPAEHLQKLSEVCEFLITTVGD